MLGEVRRFSWKDKWILKVFRAYKRKQLNYTLYYLLLYKRTKQKINSARPEEKKEDKTILLDIFESKKLTLQCSASRHFHLISKNVRKLKQS